MPEVFEKVKTGEDVHLHIPQISKVLLVLRNDVDHRKAIEYTFSLAGAGSKVYLMYVVDMEPLPPQVPEDLERKLYQRYREEGNKVLDESTRMLKATGFDVEVLGVHIGIAAERILKAEKEVQPDVIVMSARGLSTLKKLLLGSVSDEVAKEAKAPVLLVK